MRSLSDVEWIFVVLAILYLFESLLWRRPGSFSFASRWGTFHRRRPAWRLIGNEHGNLELAGLLPSDAILLCHQVPLHLSSQGVLLGVVSCLNQNDHAGKLGERITWDQLKDCVAIDRHVHADGKPIVVVANAKLAESLAEQLRQIASKDGQERDHQIEQFRESMFQVDAVRSRLESWRNATKRVRTGVWLLLFWMLGVGLVWHHGLLPFQGPTWTLVYLVVLFGIWWVTVILIDRAYRRLFPGDPWGRRKTVAYSLLSPAVPTRITDALGRGLLGFVHPITLSVALDDDLTLQQVAGQIVRDAHYPIRPHSAEAEDEISQRILRDHQAAVIQCIRSVLTESGCDPNTFLEQPEREDDQSKSFCPRCLQQFDLAPTTCGQCEGTETLPFDEGSSNPS